jgi:ferredoxin
VESSAGEEGVVAPRIRVDRQSCQSSGRCVAAAPAAFAFDADRLAYATPAADALPAAEAREIADACPALAIELLDP